MNTQVKVTPDWERDGYLVIENAPTIEKYCSIKHEASNISFEKYDMFCAFSEQQFDEGLKSIRPLAEGEKVYHLGAGVYGTKDGIDKYLAYQKTLDERIEKECDPQEVYWYEWNNHECCINWEGDYDPIRIVASIWGWDEARKIRRRNTCYSIDEIIQHIENGTPLP